MAEMTAIVVSWNTRELLRRCLGSLAESAGTLPLQVIVVDNGSHDGSRQMVRMVYPWVTLLENSTNAGFARANNQGAALASAPLLLLLNSDAAVRPGALRAAFDFMQAHPEVGIAGLQLLNDDLSLQPSGKRFPTLLSTVIGLLPVSRAWRIAYDRARNARDFSQVAYVDEVSGAAMIVRRDLYEALGGFDESFYFFGEDIDLCWRAGERGYVVAYLPCAQAIHTWGSARARTPSIRQGLMSQRAQYRLLNRHKPAWQGATLRGFLIVLTALRLVRVLALMARHRETAPHNNFNLYADELRWLIRAKGYHPSGSS